MVYRGVSTEMWVQKLSITLDIAHVSVLDFVSVQTFSNYFDKIVQRYEYMQRAFTYLHRWKSYLGNLCDLSLV